MTNGKFCKQRSLTNKASLQHHLDTVYNITAEVGKIIVILCIIHCLPERCWSRRPESHISLRNWQCAEEDHVPPVKLLIP